MQRKLFDKILIANRGEIAVRIMKTLKKLGIKSVAVYSESDTNSMHVRLADEAIFIGNSPATDSYLNVEHLLSAIRQTGAQAVHPGYGFLSENANFARALASENAVLIGPSADAIKAMGDKIEAKKLAEKAGVSTVPGYLGIIKDSKEAVKIATKLGFPVILKAAAGGGGKGMRVVRSADEITDAFESASNEAGNNFSDNRVFLEKFIENPRHIEIQVLADKHGNAVCIGERECSIQRHHQKIIEEAPSPFISEKTRAAMYKQSLKLVKQIGYYSAGTVEFIIDSKQNFYFMEMNTRLQVEHCVTELIYGIDLVELMIRVAAGEKLPITQDDLKVNGWAIESRICAEDPARGFLPSSGRITRYQEPPKNSQIRVDSGIDEGGEVSMFYDQMVAKLCTHAPTRLEAIEVMRKALSEYTIAGISHNISFLEAIMQNQRFVDGNISTGFIAEEYPDGFLGAEITSELTLLFLGVAIQLHMTESIRAAAISGMDASAVGTRWIASLEGQLYPLIIKPVTDGYNIRYESNRIYVRSSWNIGATLFRGVVNGRNVNVRVERTMDGYKLIYAGRNVEISIRSPRVSELEQFMPVKSKNKFQTNLSAPLSGKIVKIFVAPGDEIKAGQKLVIIEAMKMENLITAEQIVKIANINVAEGDHISVGTVLIDFEV